MSALDPAESAVLVIRADDAAPASRIAAVLRRLFPRERHDRASRDALRLDVDDLRGRRHATVEQAGVVTRLALPVGTYLVTVARAGRTRRYTLALEAGAVIELDVRSGSR